MKDDLISRRNAVECVYKALRTPQLKGVFTDTMSLAIGMVNDLPSAQSEIEKKILAIGYTGKEGHIYIGGRLFAVRELSQ